MSRRSSIEWTDVTWNPVAGCTKVSEGCAHCYAERLAHRLGAMATRELAAGENPGRKAMYRGVSGPRGWSGRVNVDRAALAEPLRWRAPRFVFVNSMADLFHPEVDAGFLSDVFAVMRDCPRHVFQVLTRRPERALELADRLPWPANVWFGVSVENARAKSRIALLRRVPARLRFLSVEPLIGPLGRVPLKAIDWVICGGESGPGARPLDPEWVRSLRDQCMRRDVPFFFKQWGGVQRTLAGRVLDGRTWDQRPAPLRRSG